MQASVSVLVAETTWGPIRIHLAHGCVERCDLPTVRRRPLAAPALLRFHASIQAADRVAARRAETFLKALWSGRQAHPPALRVPPAGAFVTEAWRQLARIPSGSTVSYGELAALAGRPRAARAAGTACATNRIPLFIPCHRVLAAGGRLGGFSGGLPWKSALLALERVSVRRA